MKGALSAVARRIAACGLIPIIRFDRLEQAEKIVAALWAAKVDIVEFPMTSPLALKAIEKISDALGDSMVVGAGTVLDAKTARTCMLAGARFIVSPCVNTTVISACRRKETVVCPGALTPTEVAAAWEAGADFVKVFPCNSVGGAAYIASLKTPLPHLAMVPVGGVTADNAGDFIRAGSAALGVGAGLVDKETLFLGHYEKVTRKAGRFVRAVAVARKTLPAEADRL